MDDETHGAQPDSANPPEDEADSYTRRQAALRALARSQQQQQAVMDTAPAASAQPSATHAPAAPSGATLPAGPRGRRRGAIFGAAAVAIIAIVALIVILVAN